MYQLVAIVGVPSWVAQCMVPEDVGGVWGEGSMSWSDKDSYMRWFLAEGYLCRHTSVSGRRSGEVDRV